MNLYAPSNSQLGLTREGAKHVYSRESGIKLRQEGEKGGEDGILIAGI